MRRLPAPATDPADPVPAPPRAVAPTPAPTAPDAAAPPSGRTWQVRPGDHFWSIAERVLAQTWPDEPTDAEVDLYWRALVAANTELLRDRDNPDLLFPGQVIAVPPAPPAPSGTR